MDLRNSQASDLAGWRVQSEVCRNEECKKERSMFCLKCLRDA